MANDLTLLQIVQTAFRELGLNAPSAVVNSQDLQVQQVLALLNRDGNDMYRSRNWTFLSGEHIVNLEEPVTITADVTEGSVNLTNCSSIAGITTAFAVIDGTGMPAPQRVGAAPSGSTIPLEMEATASATATEITLVRDTFTLPSDFDRYISHTWWDRTNHWMLIGPQSPQFDQWQRSGIVTTGPRRRWRQIGIRPTVYRIWPPPTANDVPAALVFEYINDGWAVHTDASGTITYGSRFTADTDTTLLDNQAMILGCKWRMWQIKGFSYAAMQQEYIDYVNRLKAQDGGMPDLNMGRRRFPYLISSANVQDADFPGP